MRHGHEHGAGHEERGEEREALGAAMPPRPGEPGDRKRDTDEDEPLREVDENHAQILPDRP